MSVRIIVICVAVGLLSVAVGAQTDPADSVRVDSLAPVPEDSTTLPDDSVQTEDHLTVMDSILWLNPDIDPDTLTEAQRMLLEFETRYELHKRSQPRERAAAQLSYFDSLAVYLVSSRWNLREDIDRSFYHDAGDYFRSDPGFFILEHQVTPMRKTVQPYGLAGDRLGFFYNDMQLTPFEHIIEPDGLTDLNDIPTALNDQVAILPGAVGLVLGGRHAAATLLTRPAEPSSSSSESTFLVDKGSFGYSYARARYSKRFMAGRKIDMSVGYRNADGPAYGRDDDAYHYSGDFYFPVRGDVGVRATGWLYDRRGPLLIRPDVSYGQVLRDRIDRKGRLSLVRHNEEHTVKEEAGYSHLRQASRINEGYRGRFNYTGNGLFLAREWVMGPFLARAQLKGDYLEYDDRIESHSRTSAEAEFSLARLDGSYRYAVDLRQQWVENYRFLPAVSGMISRERKNSFMMLSVGYSERAPSLHELYLAEQSAVIYGSSGYDYTDHGNPNLASERQLIGSAELELGSQRNNASLQLTGGRIFKGIDWIQQEEGTRTVFSPANGDIDFATLTVGGRCGWSQFLNFKTGGSYHYLDYDNFESKAYTPEYQVFSGLEMHVYWPQKLIDFWAYGEVVYVGPYHGYVEDGLGKEAVCNVKLSFRMSRFRFHWVIQNVLSNVYASREYYEFPGRYNSYGFTWDFLN